MRMQPSVSTVKKLFAATGGVCEFEGCHTKLVHPESGALLGEICHIRAVSPGGPRYDQAPATSDQGEVDNLIILCPTHHSLIDQDPGRYTADALFAMKVRHENRVAALMENGLAIDNQQATDFARQVAGESVDFGIVVALPKELEALRRHFPELTAVPARTDSARIYYTGHVATALGGLYRVVATLLPLMGNLEAAHATSDLIRDWSPRFILVTGIAGGFAGGSQEFGDIVVSESIVYYEPGKVRASGLENRNRQFPCDRTLLAGMRNLSDSTWRMRLLPRPDGKQSNHAVPHIHFGPIASGEKVIAAVQEVERLRTGQANLIAVEMESAGVASAAFSALKKIGFLTVRAICDFADAGKSDAWHDYAADAAASCVRALLGTRPVAPSAGDWPSSTPGRAAVASTGSSARRRNLFDRLSSALDDEGFKNFCFLVGVDVDRLPGDRKSSKTRELILLFEHHDQLTVLESAVADIDRLVMQSGNANPLAEGSSHTTLSQSLKVRVNVALVGMRPGVSEVVFAITVENHSNQSVFIENIRLELSDTRSVFFRSDYLTKELNTRRELRASDSYSFHISLSALFGQGRTPEQFLGVLVTDAIGRTLRLQGEEFNKSLQAVFAEYARVRDKTVRVGEDNPLPPEPRTVDVERGLGTFDLALIEQLGAAFPADDLFTFFKALEGPRQRDNTKRTKRMSEGVDRFLAPDKRFRNTDLEKSKYNFLVSMKRLCTVKGLRGWVSPESVNNLQILLEDAKNSWDLLLSTLRELAPNYSWPDKNDSFPW